MKQLQEMVGYTVISNDEYRNLILENKELKEAFENSSAEEPVNSNLEKFEKHFLDELYKNNKYQIRDLEFTEDDNKLMLKIINSFSGMIDIDELGKKNYTSKKTGNGLGLFSILKYKPIKLNSSIKDNKFICVIRVNKKY